jgi:hypothetical protein
LRRGCNGDADGHFNHDPNQDGNPRRDSDPYWDGDVDWDCDPYCDACDRHSDRQPNGYGDRDTDANGARLGNDHIEPDPRNAASDGDAAVPSRHRRMSLYGGSSGSRRACSDALARRDRHHPVGAPARRLTAGSPSFLSGLGPAHLLD